MGGALKIAVVSRTALLAGVCLAALAPSIAFGGAFGLHEQSAEALGESFAGVAAGAGGLSAMFWNPATLTNNPGLEVSGSVTAIIPYARDLNTTSPLNFVAPAAGNPAAFLPSTTPSNTAVALPAGYASYQFNDQLYLGLAINTPFGLSTKNPVSTAPALWGMTTTVFTTDINPQIAYKINDWISVGIGLQAEYMEVRETNQDPSALALGVVAVDALKGNSWGVGFNLGIDLKPMDGTEIGIGYRSQVREGLKGSLSAFTTLPGIGLTPLMANVSAPLTLPDSLSIGIRQRVTPTFTLLAGVEWTDWSRLQTLTVTTTSAATPFPVVPVGTPVVVDQLKFRDGWMFSLGGEYKWSDAITLRAGAAYEIAPITNSNRDVRLLDSDRIWLSLGASYKVSDKLKLDLSYAHVFYQGGTINILPGGTTPAIPLGYTGKSSASGDIVSVGFTYRLDEAPAKALVAKY